MDKKVLLVEKISEIRELLSKKDIHGAYDKMISLNTVYEDIDNYTCYFANSIDIDLGTDCDVSFEIDEDNGTIVVESVLGEYIPAKITDIEDTLEEIESEFL